jgi:hypothetical protein
MEIKEKPLANVGVVLRKMQVINVKRNKLIYNV